MTDTSPEKVTVVGLGLMGGSLARAFRALSSPPHVTGLTRLAVDAEAATAAGAVDTVASDPAEALSGADVVVYATPLNTVLELLERHRPHLGGETVVTDVASLKVPVVDRARALGLDDRYVGSHPMSGGEGSGFHASRDGLYHGSAVWIVDDTGTGAARDRVERMWTDLGATPVVTSAEEHDRRMAWASHLPQIAANALAHALSRAGYGIDDLGPGGRDTTRLAASSPTMWRDLLVYSGPDDAEAVRALARTVESIADALEEGRVEEIVELMRATRRWRRGAAPEPPVPEGMRP